MSNLLKVKELDSEHARTLCRLCRRLHEVDEIELSAQIFQRVQLHRNNQFYDFLLKVCELIYENLLPSQDQGSSKFRDFIQDDQMAHVFESFVRNFYKLEQSIYRVKREDIYWQWEEVEEGTISFLPKMQTDMSLISSTRKIVIDCKFTPEATKNRYESEKLRSEHLYQINAYLGNMHSEENQKCEVMLLYPTIDRELKYSYRDSKGRKIQIRTINLNQDWQKIKTDLLDVLKEAKN